MTQDAGNTSSAHKPPPATLLRQGGDHRGQVSSVELFFDLVFVFAVTQLSHSLVAHLDATGFLHALVLLLAVWWVWVYTAWVTNWLDPERTPVRLLLFAMMGAGLVFSASIPAAFAGGGLALAGSYVLMQVGRTLFFLWAVRGESPHHTRNFQRILAWLALAGVFWIVGGYVRETRIAWWALALAIEIAGPFAYFAVPGLGRSTTADWDIEGGHIAERCGLFVIIALGESLLVTGATSAQLPTRPDTVLAFALAVLGTILMWWLYFDTGAERALRRIRHSDDPGRQGRLAYTYLHLPIVAGIILGAVADELVLVHPGHADRVGGLVIVGAPFVYLLGISLFKWVTNDRRLPPLSHLAGLVLLGGVAWAGMASHASPLALSAATTAVLLVVAVWEGIALRRT